MKKPKYSNYRVCYDNGNPATGKKIYELYKYCTCPDCKNRSMLKREPANRITITTKDISKVDEAAKFLKNWICADGKRWLEIVCLKF
ncbi:hypothetical protein D3C77_267030 [compost metagenome]